MKSRRLIFAIGDIHGRYDLARAALDEIARTSETVHRIIFLGDYVDRGPDSRALIDWLIDLSEDPRVVCLKGNHEALMLRAIDDKSMEEFETWRSWGGAATIASYGAAEFDDMVAATPERHLRWLRALPLSSGDGHRVYVHAGMDPSIPFERQADEVLLWIRERFLRAGPQDFEVHVVHGHTPVWEGKSEAGEPEMLPHRTNLDLAAYSTGRLGVGVFDADRPGGPLEVKVICEEAGRITVETRSPPEAPPVPPRQSTFGRLKLALRPRP